MPAIHTTLRRMFRFLSTAFWPLRLAINSDYERIPKSERRCAGARTRGVDEVTVMIVADDSDVERIGPREVPLQAGRGGPASNHRLQGRRARECRKCNQPRRHVGDEPVDNTE